MEQTRITSHIIKAIVIAVVLMAWDYFIAHKTTLNLPLVVRLLPAIWMVAGVAVSGIIYDNQTNGSQRFGDVFAHGFKTTAMVAVIIAVYTFIIIKFVFPPTAHDIELNMKALMEQGGMLEQEARRNAEAIAILQKAIAKKPGDGALEGNLAKALRAEKRYAEAIPHYEAAIKAGDDRDAGLWFDLAYSYEQTQQKDKALDAYKRHLALIKGKDAKGAEHVEEVIRKLEGK
jgi:tetratricopeptide (TPR) repeat protein